MSRRTQNAKTQLAVFIAESRNVFRRQYAATGLPSVLIAQNDLETYVEQGAIDPKDALALIRNPVDFAEFLLKSEDRYQKSEDQKVHARMSNLERNTNWKPAAVVSFGTGMLTGIVFTFVGPFASTWLQPTADRLFKHQPTAQAQMTSQPQAIQNITTNNVYNFYPAEAARASTQPPAKATVDTKPKVTLTCKNMSVDAYKASLLELLQRGDVVTLETNGKKVSMCFRPNVQSRTQQRALHK